MNNLNILHSELNPCISAHERTAVAVSGGMDSMSLLTVLSAQARAAGQVLYAFHIHHGLQAQAEEWVQVVHDYCVQLGVVFDVVRINDSASTPARAAAQSVEEWARDARYQALVQLAQKHGVTQIVLAQHQDDQIETYLLQKNRGAGARGLAAMPGSSTRWDIRWLRPWLGVSRAQIEAFVQENTIPYVNDPSNQDTRFARNAIRAQLRERPLTGVQRAEILCAIGAAQASLQQQREWAQAQLLKHHAEHRADIGESGRLHAMQDSGYTDEQMHLLIREWFAQMGWRMPSRAGLAELLKQLRSTRPDPKICWRHPDGGAVTRLKNDWMAAQLLPAGQWWLSDALTARMQSSGWEIRARTGGERFRLGLNRPRISLKHAYQMCGVATMLRAQLPLFYHDGRLVHVTGVGDVLS